MPGSNELTLEKMRVDGRLTTVESKLSTVESRMGTVESKLDVLIAETRLRNENDRKMLDSMQTNITALNYTVNGNGKPGLAEKVRKLEGLAAHVAGLTIATVGFTLNAIKDWFIHTRTGG